MKKPYFTLWIDTHGYGFTLWGANGQQLAHAARHYTRKDSARRGAERVALAFVDAPTPAILDSHSLSA